MGLAALVGALGVGKRQALAVGDLHRAGCHRGDQRGQPGRSLQLPRRALPST
jgi:hypothetical protein